ncbi:hypothetical protein PAECIP111893_04875 [Paenibacillus plantiphilus]|uniref:Uncharacterized protein n=1 Tax=Paenibacillus plantiphilus TaxID=2905650 RepID=A0ABN8H6I5_9BACL|nr:hypothetical protein PAECIP111893_04875 [Paenibacillus plantiphilus]
MLERSIRGRTLVRAVFRCMTAVGRPHEQAVMDHCQNSGLKGLWFDVRWVDLRQVVVRCQRSYIGWVVGWVVG